MNDELILDFATDNLGDVDSFDPIPDGRYDVVASAVAVKPTKDGTGRMLTVTWTVIDGDYKGRKLFDRLNVVNKSEVAQKIGRAQLGNRLKATGLEGENDMGKIVGRECNLSVRIRAAEGAYQASNEINRADAIGGVSRPSAPGLDSDGPAIGQGGRSPAAKKAPPPFMRK
jgi:hypothetical protein